MALSLAKGESKVVVPFGATQDQVIDLMFQIVEFAKRDELMQYFASEFARSENPMVSLYWFLWANTDFIPVPDKHQKMKTPRAVLDKKEANCVDYSVFISTILSLLGIPHSFRFVTYPEPFGSGEQANIDHVYVVADDGTVLDASDQATRPLDRGDVEQGKGGQFNVEAPYLYKLDIPVRL